MPFAPESIHYNLRELAFALALQAMHVVMRVVYKVKSDTMAVTRGAQTIHHTYIMILLRSHANSLLLPSIEQLNPSNPLNWAQRLPYLLTSSSTLSESSLPRLN
jgi:hypothetical protein